MRRYKFSIRLLLFITVPGILSGCQNEVNNRFESVPKDDSGIAFTNTIKESDSLNYFKYPYLYMGGGVAIADFDNDGLQDLFFTGNMVENKLYHNQGEFRFEDISVQAQVEGARDKWYTGVSVADVNADGYSDIYLCVSGISGDRSNELYINNKNLTFTESAAEFNLADISNSVQASFFDYDHDGDLDVFVANYPITSFTTSNFTYKFNADNPTMQKSDHLYENLGNGSFQNVTEESGLLSYGLSLSATVVDFNDDGWEDIYISNDFSTPDYFFINNQDGTFTDHLKTITNQTSFYGMGTDAADYNNDGLIDLFQVDMSAADNRRAKANMASMNPSLFWSTVNNGFHYQYMYNSLQMNRGIIDSIPRMSNVAWISGVSSTDWSWSPIFADFDNDGWKDLFVANGTRKEINNRDYFKKIDSRMQKATDSELLSMSDSIPSEPIDNYIFRNNQGKGFDKYNAEWNVKFSGFSNGAAYGDLDNDGDLDLVVNNIDEPASLFRNQTESIAGGNYLRLNITKQNAHLIGCEVEVHAGSLHQKNQLQPVRGFQSSAEPFLHFGLGNETTVDSIIIKYDGNTVQKLVDVNSNQQMSIDLSSPVNQINTASLEKQSIFIKSSLSSKRQFAHWENNFNDYKHQVLLPHKMSNFGPALAVGDVNGDGLDDMFIGGAAGVQAMLLFQDENGEFVDQKFQEKEDMLHEDLDALFVDLDNDQDLDLYLVSGGNEFEENSMEYQDRIYINTNGTLSRVENVLPDMKSSGSKVRPFDYDKDGDVDLFIGGRLSPLNYPISGRSYLLKNLSEKGTMKFEDVTAEIAPDLPNVGMVTDALWTDINSDGNIDLMVVGEWMVVKTFLSKDGKFTDQEVISPNDNSTGWWFSINQGDFDNDGDIDYIAGNLGLNYKYQAKKNETFDLYVSDFDGNRSNDIVLSYHNFGEKYPVRGRQCSSEQIPALQVAYKDYNSFSTASMEDIFGTETLQDAMHFSVEDFSSVLWVNDGNGSFSKKSLPWEAQLAPVNDILVNDINEDGNLDVVLVGNLFASEVETPRGDAGMGLLLLGDGSNEFRSSPITESGIYIPYDSKQIRTIKVGENKGFVVANNQGPVQLFLKN